METKTTPAKKMSFIAATTTVAPTVSQQTEKYYEVTLPLQLKNGRNVKVYAFNKVAAAAINNIKENLEVVVFGKFVASDVFKMSGFKIVTPQG